MTSGADLLPDSAGEHDPADTEVDRRFVSLAHEPEIQAWMASLECTEQELRDAVAAVGNSADAVLNHLTRNKD
jgi:hypothetical protein